MITFNLVTNDFSCMPTKATSASAGYDLRAYIQEAITIHPGKTAVIPTGISTSFGKHIVGMICSRSGLAAKHQVFVLNSPGIIDADYTDEIKVILMNMGTEVFVVEPLNRIAQIVFTQVADPFGQNTVSATRTGGFGSTGTE